MKKKKKNLDEIFHLDEWCFQLEKYLNQNYPKFTNLSIYYNKITSEFGSQIWQN